MAAGIAIASLIGSGVQSYGMRQSGKLEQAAYQGRAMQAELDAMEFDTRTMLERASIGIEEGRLRRKMDSVQGTQKAAAAKSGVLVSGSTAQVLSQSAQEQELDALMLRFNSDSRVLASQLSASRSRMSASNLRAEGKSARSQRNASSNLNLLMGGVSAASTYMTLSKFNSLGGANGSNTKV